MRCAIYARYSSDMQRPESIEDQVRQCQRYIESKSWVVRPEQIYSDHAESGSDMGRSDYRRLKEAARTLIIDCVVVDDLSRLGRDAAESIAVFQELGGLGIKIVGIADGIDTASTNSKLPFYFKSVMNEIFLDDLKEKVRRGMRGQVVRGYSAGGRLYGYGTEPVYDPGGAVDRFGRPVRYGVRIHVKPDEAAVVRRIFEMAVSGLGLRATASQLNAEAIPSPQKSTPGRSGRWCPSTIRQILRQPKYIGDWTWNKTRWDRKSQSGKRAKVPNPPEKWERYESKDLRIVSDELWHAVHERVGNAGRTRGSLNPAGRRGKHILSGLLKCSECGASMVLTNSGKYSAYVCNGYWTKGTAVCSNRHRVNRHRLEGSFFDNLSAALSAKEVIDDVTRRVRRAVETQRSQTGPSRRALLERRDEIKRATDHLVAFIEQGRASPSVSDRLGHLESELAQIERELAIRKAAANVSAEVAEERVKAAIYGLRESIERRPRHVPSLRQSLRGLFPDKLTVRNLVDNEGTFETIIGGPCGHREQPLSPPIMFFSGTGDRTPV